MRTQRDEYRSFWVSSAPSPGYERLEADVTADVAVVGAGIFGLSAAYLLKQEGLSVVVIDRGEIAGGVTGYTTAKVTSSHGIIYSEIARKFGDEGARTYATSNQAGLERIASLVDELSIDCDFERADNFIYTEHEDSLDSIRSEVDAARAAGLPASFTTDTQLPFPVLGALRVADQAQFHPRKYLAALARAIDGDGSRIYEHTVATGIRESHPSTVTTREGSIAAADVIVATHMPMLDRGLFFTKVHPYRSYVVAGYPSGEPLTGMYISTGGPTRSLRSTPGPDGRLLLVGGEGHKTGTDADTQGHYDRLEEWAADRFDVTDPVYRWATQDNVSVDRVPYVGRVTRGSDHVLTATGFGKWGLTNGTMAAMILTDHIVGRANEWAALYDSKRIKPAASAQKFVEENVGVASHFIGDRIASEHRGNPRCTHLGCVLRRNGAEGTWDCPCHGSRFDAEGNVIQGPAVEDLEGATLPRE
jgi:glycine/D-amino acid oxidase-like deaminating enzyme